MENSSSRTPYLSFGWILVALCSMVVSGWCLLQPTAALNVQTIQSGSVPISIYRQNIQPAQPMTQSETEAEPGPLVVLAHGFAGSRPMMQHFAVTLARNGYTAATFDLSGHGRNRSPLTGDLEDIQGATQNLLLELTQVEQAIREHLPGLPTDMAVLGHSMSSDLVVRYALNNAHVKATIGVSLFSPAIEPTRPANLLIINGELESRLNEAALAVVAQVAEGQLVVPEHTYGEFSEGSARRLVEADHLEHVGVLFSRESALESLTWLDQVFGVQVAESISPIHRGLWIILLIVSIVMLSHEVIAHLPRLAPTVKRPRQRPLAAMVLVWGPALLTPLLLQQVDIDFLPILVGDYLAVHFLAYGLVTAAFCLAVRQPAHVRPRSTHPIIGASSLLALLVVATLAVLMFVALDWQVASMALTPERARLLVSVLAGTLIWSICDEWATRRVARWRFAYVHSKLALMASLGFAVALDMEALFFLLLIIPIILPLVMVFGLSSYWTHRVTGVFWIAAVVNACVIAWAIAATFPLLGSM